MTLSLKSPAFGQGETIPARYTCEGEDVSPPLEWSGVPGNARTLLLVCNDPDAPQGVFHHWAAYNIPASWTGLQEGYRPGSLEEGFREAINDFGKPGYAGPCPPRGDEPHGYRFRLSALQSEIVSAAPSASCAEILEIARPHLIELAELVGFYGRERR